MCLNSKEVNYVAFLHEIATEHQFEVTYVDIEEKTFTGRCQCLVQLSTLPVAGKFKEIKILNFIAKVGEISSLSRSWTDFKRCAN